LLALLALACERGAKHRAECDAEERIRYVRAIVDILLQLGAFPGGSAPTAHEGNRIDFDREGGCAALGIRFGIKDVSFTEGHFLRFASGRDSCEADSQSPSPDDALSSM
jgi:hypothetical protein